MYATGTMARYSYPYPPYSFVLGLILGSRVRDVRCTERRSSLAWEKECMTAVSREETDGFEYLLTLVGLPRPHDRARKGLDPGHSCTPHFLPTRSTIRAGLWLLALTMLGEGLTNLNMQYVYYVQVM